MGGKTFQFAAPFPWNKLQERPKMYLAGSTGLLREMPNDLEEVTKWQQTFCLTYLFAVVLSICCSCLSHVFLCIIAHVLLYVNHLLSVLVPV